MGLGAVCLAVAWGATAASEPPEAITWTTALGPVAFPHLLHVEDLGVACEDCHHETSAERLTMPHPDYFEDFWIDCASCPGSTASPGRPRACSSCHPSTPAGVADETSSSKVVIHRACWECHEVASGEEASRGCVACHPSFAEPRGGASAAALSGSAKEDGQ